MVVTRLATKVSLMSALLRRFAGRIALLATCP
jgi:hypothetical protein